MGSPLRGSEAVRSDQKPSAAKIKRMGVAAAKVCVILAVFILCIIAVNNRPKNFISVNPFIDCDVTYANGETSHFDNKYFGSINKGDVATVHIRLPEEPLMDDAVLTFYNFNTVTEIWFGHTLLDSFGEDLAAKNMLIGNHRFFVHVPDDAWGSEITVIQYPTENHEVTDFIGAVIYPVDLAYQSYLYSDPVGFVVSIALLLIGAIGLLICILSGMRGKSLLNGLYLALFAMLMALWIISNKMIYSMYGLTDYFWQPLEYMAGYTVSIPVLLFYHGMTDKKSKWNKVFALLAALSAALFILSTVLNFTNILHFNAFMNTESVLIVLSGLLLMIYTLCLKQNDRSSITLLKTGMTFFVLACIYEIAILFSFQFTALAFMRSYPDLISIGALCMLLCLGGAYISDTYEKQKDALAAQLKAETLNKMIAATPAGICRLGTDEEIPILSANDIYYDILGISKAQTLQDGKSEMLKGMDAETQKRIHELRDALLTGGATTGSVEFNLHGAQNRGRTILAQYHYDKEDSGNVMVCVMDITDRKRMEDELRVREERYRLALTQSGKKFVFLDVKKRTMSLPDELTQIFGLPKEVDNMPDNFIAQGFVVPQSVENYRQFYYRIYGGEPSGDTIIACHTKNAPDIALWYRLAFTSVFDSDGKPSSAIIIYEDLQEARRQKIEGAWKQLNLVSVPESSYVVAQYNLTQDKPLLMSGGMFTKPPGLTGGYDTVCDFILKYIIFGDDVAAYRTFADRNRLLSMFESGQYEDSMECRAIQSENGSAYRWTVTNIQMIRDPYSGDVLAQFMLKDIDDEKTGIVKMERSIDELRRELEQSRIRVMINQMQPHFLYNALSAIRTIIKTEPDYAYQLVYDFTVHLRSNIKALQSDAPILFAEEMKNVKAYLNIEKMRMGDRLKFVYDIQCEDFSVIPLSIQPLTENAARHGIYPRGAKGGTLTVRSYETESAYVVEVIDDGVGFDVHQVLNTDNESVGLKNLIFRMKTLMNAEVKIVSIPNDGTTVTVIIPKGEKEA